MGGAHLISFAFRFSMNFIFYFLFLEPVELFTVKFKESQKLSEEWEKLQLLFENWNLYYYSEIYVSFSLGGCKNKFCSKKDQIIDSVYKG